MTLRLDQEVTAAIQKAEGTFFCPACRVKRPLDQKHVLHTRGVGIVRCTRCVERKKRR